MILGTGTNACYLEDIDNVGTWDGGRGDTKHVIINTEWGAFGNKVCHQTETVWRLSFLRGSWTLSGPSGTS